jgi:MFS family permease
MVFIAVAIVGVMTGLASLPGARLSDRFGRKPVLYGGMALTAFGLAGLALAPSPTVAIILFIPAGLGIGSFLSVDWALMTDVIPKHTSARYMGVLNAGTAMAEPVYLVFGGLTLTAAGLLSNNPVTPAGPVAAIWVGVVFLALAALALTQVDATRREAVEVAELAAA